MKVCKFHNTTPSHITERGQSTCPDNTAVVRVWNHTSSGDCHPALLWCSAAMFKHVQWKKAIFSSSESKIGVCPSPSALLPLLLYGQACVISVHCGWRKVLVTSSSPCICRDLQASLASASPETWSATSVLLLHAQIPSYCSKRSVLFHCNSTSILFCSALP